MRWPVLLVALAACLVAGLGLLLGGTDPDAVPTPSAVNSRVMSPFCPGLTLDECPTDQSARLRSQIESMIRQGRTNREIDAWVVENYGDSALATPRSKVAWLAPVALGLAGLALTVAFVSRRTGGSTGDAAAREPVLGAEEAALVEEDFNRYQRGTE